jgi:hypothetical protein
MNRPIESDYTSMTAYTRALEEYCDALAQPAQQEKFCDANCVWTDHHPDCKFAQPAPVQEPVGKLQEPTGERAWFTIAELNAWADKKLSENPHWVMPKDEPERDEPPPQRTWVGLTDEEMKRTCYEVFSYDPYTIARAIEAKLKEKNT